LSDFGDPSQGPLGALPGELAIDHLGNILVVDSVPERGVLFSVNPSTGARTIISDFGNPSQGPLGHPGGTGLAIENLGEILITDPFTAGSNGRGALFRVNPSTGVRTIISDFGNPSQGPLGRPAGLTVDDSGDILVGGAAVFRVKPFTGIRAIISGFSASDVAIVPTPIVNDMVSLSPLATSLDPIPVANAPAGTFIITATFSNMTSTPISSPFFRVVEVSGGNLLLNADSGPGGVGARLIPDVGTDGTLSPGESVTADFLIGLQVREPFLFLINVFGVPIGTEQIRTAGN
jgi:hypothetical protein